MRLPTIQGLIKRRILANYRADPDVIQKLLPQGFRPKLHKGKAIAGICLIRLEHIRPRFTPEILGMSSENAAHRIAVEWEGTTGVAQEGVYVPRRDTNSFLNHMAGGTLFPGEHNSAAFQITEDGNHIDFSMRSDDHTVSVDLKGISSDGFPENSIFASREEASSFFEKGSLGYSVTRSGKTLDGVILQIKDWEVKVLDIDSIESSFYNDENVFPRGSIEFDHALIMRNIAHEWHGVPSLHLS